MRQRQAFGKYPEAKAGAMSIIPVPRGQNKREYHGQPEVHSKLCCTKRREGDTVAEIEFKRKSAKKIKNGHCN